MEVIRDRQRYPWSKIARNLSVSATPVFASSVPQLQLSYSMPSLICRLDWEEAQLGTLNSAHRSVSKALWFFISIPRLQAERIVAGKTALYILKPQGNPPKQQELYFTKRNFTHLPFALPYLGIKGYAEGTWNKAYSLSIYPILPLWINPCSLIGLKLTITRLWP